MQEESVAVKAKLLWKDLVKQVAKEDCSQIRDGQTICKRLEEYYKSLGEFCI